MNNNLETLDILSIISFCIGILNYQSNLKQTSNDELLKELKIQDTDYLQKIISQNEEILKLLKGGKNEN